MTNATATMLAALNELFVTMDAKVLVDAKAWGERKRVAVAEKRAELQPTRRAIGEWEFYGQLHNVAGGKSWFKVFDQNSAANVETFMIKNSKAIADKRNATIAKKLEAAGITSIVSSDYQRTTDGFDGTYVVETDTGRKVVTINSIYAGGYNIQCFHLRVLVKVK